MKCVQCNEVELEPSKGSRPRRYCSRKCANRWLYKNSPGSKSKYVKKNPDWGAKTRAQEKRKERYEWCKENLLTMEDIANEYGFCTGTGHRKAKLLELKAEQPRPDKQKFYTKEQAVLIGTTPTEAIQTETAAQYRNKARQRDERERKDPTKLARRRDRARSYSTERRKDPKHRLRYSVSLQMNAALKKQGKMKQWAAFEKTGYTPQQLAEHIERQFDDKMTWDNYGTYWQLDHIVPQCVLQYDSMEHPNFKKCWALENLQPLARSENASKGSFYEGQRHSW